MSALRTRVKLAQRLDDAWRKQRRQGGDLLFQWKNVLRHWSELADRQARFQWSQELGFRHCRESLDEDFRWSLNSLVVDLQRLRNHLGVAVHEPGLRDWLNELQSIQDEFGDFAVDVKRSILSVETDSITLKDVPLGRFSIEFHWSRLETLRGIHCFDVVALDPNPAAEREDTTHPHLNGTELCPGEAEAPLAAAVREGRIADAFLMIRAVLTTYNPRSAYVPLDEWDGSRCQDCAGRVRREDTSTCGGCEHDLCEGCASYCRCCEETRCSDCLTACDDCSDLCCDRCRERISSGEGLCPSCRGQCSNCQVMQARSVLDDQECCPNCAATCEQPSPELPEASHA